VQPQFLPNLIFSGIADRYPRLNWVCAETGAGWLGYLMEACDHVWERQKLWREQVRSRPSDVFRRQIHVTFWYEKAGLQMCRALGLENLMWASDYPHGTSTFPESWELVDETTAGIPATDREDLLFRNVRRLYHLD
jgi:predicted TIM-barrel fold metal-dependent hydrolase